MNTLTGNSRCPDITFHIGGRIDITAYAVKALHLHPGDLIDIAVEGSEYYLYVRARSEALIGRHTPCCHPTKRGSRNYRAHSRRLSNIILRLTGGMVARLPIGEPLQVDGYAAVPLIIRSKSSDNNTQHE